MSVKLSHNWNWAVDMVMWPKFVNSSISLRKIIIASFLYGFDKKTNFFEYGLGSIHIFRTGNSYKLEILHQPG